jgi:hypothetical protein
MLPPKFFTQEVAMVTKAPDIYRHQREQRRRAYTLSPLVREEYPRVEHVTMELKFTDPAGIGHHSQQTHTFAAGARAYFMVSCPFSTCVEGGFDLSGAVADMISHQSELMTGRMVCQGWHDRNHPEARRCNLELQYKITASYDGPTES